ncbi:unnamed protein product, partial [Discosporangium mesarthrocarpum]
MSESGREDGPFRTLMSITRSFSAMLESVDGDIASQGLSEVYTTLGLNAVIFVILVGLFEAKRSKRSVYAPRLERYSHRVPPPPPSSLFGWIRLVLSLSGDETLRMAGMDAYCLLRFTKLCLRICLFSSFWGMLVLAPVYSTGDGNESGFYQITLANVKEQSTLLWVAVVFAYLFTVHCLYELKTEHKAFARLREDFLARGDPDFVPQYIYSVQV